MPELDILGYLLIILSLININIKFTHFHSAFIYYFLNYILTFIMGLYFGRTLNFIEKYTINLIGTVILITFIFSIFILIIGMNINFNLNSKLINTIKIILDILLIYLLY